MKYKNELQKRAHQTQFECMELRNKNQTYKSEKWKFTKTINQAITSTTGFGKNILQVSVNNSL